MSLDVKKARADAVAMLNSGAPDIRCVTHLSISLERALGEVVRLQKAIRCELDEGDLEACGPRADLRALLPPDERGTDDAV